MDKSEIMARIDELSRIEGGPIADDYNHYINSRIKELKKLLKTAPETISESIVRSHKAICKIKNMDEKAAYGNDPSLYYTLAICGEAGELANNIVKTHRNDKDQEKILEAIKSELPDVIIYSYVLAYVFDINLPQLVNEKVDVVVRRAHDGYYGGPFK